MIVTARLQLRELTEDDAAFIHALLNEPSWIRFIGDKQIHGIDDARAYLVSGPLASYARNGFGLYLVERAQDCTPMGLCGLIRREGLQDLDIGFAFRPAYWRQGYALEAARAVIDDARRRLGLTRLAAITSLDNSASIRIVGKLGLKLQGKVRLGPDELLLFVGDVG